MKRVVPRLQGPAKILAKRELIGRACRVAKANDPGIIGLAGDIVDETLHTLTLRIDGRRIQLAKSGATFDVDGVEIEGRAIQFRPEDRSKKVK